MSDRKPLPEPFESMQRFITETTEAAERGEVQLFEAASSALLDEGEGEGARTVSRTPVVRGLEEGPMDGEMRVNRAYFTHCRLCAAIRGSDGGCVGHDETDALPLLTLERLRLHNAPVAALYSRAAVISGPPRSVNRSEDGRPLAELDALDRQVRGALSTFHNKACDDCLALAQVGDACEKHTPIYDALNTLLATARAGLEDRERLDWLEQQTPNLNYSLEFNEDGALIAVAEARIDDVEDGDTLGSGTTVRAAIDDAREKDQTLLRTRSGRASKFEGGE